MKKQDKFSFYYSISLVGQIGWSVAVPLIVFILIGVFLDKQFGTKPALTLGGLVLGMIVSFYSLYQFLKPFLRTSQTNKKNNKKEKTPLGVA